MAVRSARFKQGTVTASLILRKLGAYPRQNSLALALREFGRLGDRLKVGGRVRVV